MCRRRDPLAVGDHALDVVTRAERRAAGRGGGGGPTPGARTPEVGGPGQAEVSQVAENSGENSGAAKMSSGAPEFWRTTTST